MSKSLPTVAVNRGGHLAIINQSDFDPNVDTLWSDSDAKGKPKGLRVGDEIKTETSQETEVTLPIKSRLDYLQSLASEGQWRALKAIAESHGIARPADGWDATVLPILVAEYGQSVADGVL